MRALPLRVTVPLAILLSALAAAGLGLWVGLALARATVFTRALATGAAQLSEEEHALDAALRRGDEAFVEELVTGLAGDRSVPGAQIVDGLDLVVASTRPAEIGLAAVYLPQVSALVGEARVHGGPLLIADEENHTVWGAIRVGPAGPPLGGQQSVVPLIEHDVSEDLALSLRDGQRATGVFALLVAASAGLEPFFTTKPPGEGSGLGLAVTREILTRAGATIELESVPGVGTTFSVRFAVASPSAEPSPAVRAEAPVASSPALRVLVIDDEPLLVRALTRMMKGHQVTTASGPNEGLKRCEGADFDRILCDLSMPEGGGRAFFRGLVARRPDLVERLVFMTGGASSSVAHAFLETSNRPVLDKPIDPARLRGLLHDATSP